MRRIRNNHRILGAFVLAVLCLGFAAAPASAHLDREDFDSGAGVEQSIGARVSMAFTALEDSFFGFLQKLGAIFAQEGARVDD